MKIIVLFRKKNIVKEIQNIDEQKKIVTEVFQVQKSYP